jgi:dTDP-4-dehydrorhamnose 3,5-epimerase
MIFHSTMLAGVFEIEMVMHRDDRGFFARSWCEQEFQEYGLNPKIVQCNVSMNERNGTLRGLHYQAAPFSEAKLVRCTAGRVFDVALDLREGSRTFLSWHGAVLSAENRLALYIPEGCAHGFLTLEDQSEVLYQMSEFYHPEASRGVRWDDPAFEMDWPGKVEVISDRDRSYPNFVIK